MQGLFNSFSKEMMATSQRITNSKVDTEDILQEAFLKSFQKIGQLKEDKLYGGWLKQIVINASLQLVKKRINYSTLEQAPEIEAETSESNWYEGIPFDTIKQAIQNLPDGSRAIFSLHLLDGYKHKEIAEVLGVSISTSKSQYRYALKLLKEELTHIIYE